MSFTPEHGQLCWRQQSGREGMEKGEGGRFVGEMCKSQSSAAEILSQHPTPCPSDIPNKTLHPLRLPALAEDAGHLFSKCWAQQVPPAHAAHTRCHPTQTDVTNYTNRELAGAACLLRLSGSSEHSQRGISLFLRLLLLHRLLPVTFFRIPASLQRKKRKTPLKVGQKVVLN